MEKTGKTLYVTTAIPYVNSHPHLGHALELVQADVLARNRRLRGERVRFLTGTDDNALKNVQAARQAGVEVAALVETNAERFHSLKRILDLSFDDFIRTSVDPRHRPGVERLWEECSARGDFYQRQYEGSYCLGCEQFYNEDELEGGVCAEHRVPPETVTETNWFFRLSRYEDQILDLLESGKVRVEPAGRRNEVISQVRAGLNDFSVSRPAARASGWGIPVPGDPDQVVYVWWDALANYVTALGYGTGGSAYEEWWEGAEERVHVIGKGIVRFHAVYWLALLLSAGLPLPTKILVHDYLSVDGEKLSKSRGNALDPGGLVEEYGVDAVRWWLVRDVARTGDTDFTRERLVKRHDVDLANGLGNLANRTLTLVSRHRGGVLREAEADPAWAELAGAVRGLEGDVDAALERFDLRGATDALWRVVDAANRLVNEERPWELARSEAAGDEGAGERLDAVLSVLVSACRAVTHELGAFLPSGAALLAEQLGTGTGTGEAAPVFRRIG